MEAFSTALALWAKKQALGWLARHGPKLVGFVLAAAVGTGFLGMTAVGLIAGNRQVAEASNACTALGYAVSPTAYQPAPVGLAPTIPTGGAVSGFGPNDGERLANARMIISAGTAAGVGRRGLIIAIATALQESGLQNLDHGDRDSVGLFQQRPSQGWGTREQLLTPDFSARAFFGGPRSPHFNAATGKASPGGLLEVPGWAELPVTAAAQAVQRSAFPTAYAKHEERATLIVNTITDSASTAEPPGPSSDKPVAEEPAVMTAAAYRAEGVDIDGFCSTNLELASAPTTTGLPGRLIPGGEWTAPLHAAITSTFGMRFHPVFHEYRLHAGTDFHAAVGTLIVSPTAGVVESVSWSSGGGLNVALAHAGGVETRHLHLSSALVNPGEEVGGGQPIALSGDSGVGTGAHYHYEVIVNGSVVDPEPFMLQHGVNLRAWT